MKQRTALLVGATGLVGSHCLDALLNDDVYAKVVVLARRVLTVEHQKLVVHLVDFERLEQHAGLLQADDIFCCLGTTIRVAGSQEAFRKVDFTYTIQAGAIGVKNGAEQVLLVSALGADLRSRVFYNRVKGEIEEAVSKLPLEGVHIFRPSLLLGDRKEFRLGEKIGELGMKTFSFAMSGPFRKYRPIEARAVARAMVSVAKENRSGINVYESDKIQAIDDATR